MWSIDWVSIRQYHQDIDNTGENICRWFDGYSGALLSEGVGYLSHKGSFSTAVSLRASGGVVEWSGNPSRWGRPDNVFGYRRMRDCVDLINGQLAEYSLPPFTVDTRRASDRRLTAPGADLVLDHSGAVLTRVDLCRNMATGSARARDAYLRAASCAVYRGKSGESRPGSVTWGSRRNSLIKFYDKSAELIANMPRLGKPPMNFTAAVRRERDAIMESIEYRKRLAAWCDDVGLIRQEVQFGRQALRAQVLRELGDWSEYRAFELAAQRVDAMKVGCSVDMRNSFDAFIDAGFTARRAAVLSGVVSAWYMGHDPAQGVSRATWYRYRADVASVLGLDLTQRPDVAVLTARVQSVDLSPAVPPAWYRYPAAA